MKTRFSEGSYPPLRDYGYIADCHSSALISRSGSIDWCCMPRVDSRSCFGRILDWNRGGYCQILPSAPCRISRRYLEDTLVLETTFSVSSGEARLIDFFPMRRGGKGTPYQQILRISEGVKGKVEFTVEIVPRFDYGAIRPWIRRYRKDHHIAIGGSDGLLISSDFQLRMEGCHHLVGTFTVEEGRRTHLSILYRRPEELDRGAVEPPATEELDHRLEETIHWWQVWSTRGKIEGPYEKQVRRSAIVLKGLSNAPTGAIAAAPTTSLPEVPGGLRNWDYRFTWIRDSYFTARSLVELGHGKEADEFRKFIERTAAVVAEDIQVFFGVGGERRLHEQQVKELEGYRRASPVRIGNAAEKQVQLDIYGELLDLAWSWHLLGNSPEDDYWEFLVELVNASAKLWAKPDQGIWEMRKQPRHFVYSKAMCWAALDRGIKLAKKLGREGPIGTWIKVRDEIFRTVEEKGYDARRGVFVQAFDCMEMDSALLLLPVVGFVDYRDERMVRTVDAIREDLEEDGLLRRYRAGNDGMKGTEGVFLPCSFWLVECLARQGRLDEAHRVFKRALSVGNDLDLFSEQYDTKNAEMLGNFPQGLTHLSLIAATVALAQMEGKDPI